MVLEHPPRPGPRAGRAAVEQPWLGVGQLGGPAAADPERKQRLAMGHPIGAHQVTDESTQVLPDAIAIAGVLDDRVTDFAGQQLRGLIGGRKFDALSLPPCALGGHGSLPIKRHGRAAAVTQRFEVEIESAQRAEHSGAGVTLKEAGRVLLEGAVAVGHQGAVLTDSLLGLPDAVLTFGRGRHIRQTGGIVDAVLDDDVGPQPTAGRFEVAWWFRQGFSGKSGQFHRISTNFRRFGPDCRGDFASWPRPYPQSLGAIRLFNHYRYTHF